PEYLAELRLQNLKEVLDLNELRRLAESSGKPKLQRAAERIVEMAEVEAREYRFLPPLKHQRSELPVVREATGRMLPALTNADISSLLEEEEILCGRRD
ncbi:MAG: hypothetical protein ACREMY_31720, partial [bacterium]